MSISPVLLDRGKAVSAFSMTSLSSFWVLYTSMLTPSSQTNRAWMAASPHLTHTPSTNSCSQTNSWVSTLMVTGPVTLVMR